MRKRFLKVTLVAAVVLVAVAATANAQALFAWEQARMKAAAERAARIQQSPYYGAQAYQWGWPSPGFVRPEIWLERPLRGYEDRMLGARRPVRPVRRWRGQRCIEPEWEVVDRWYYIVPHRPYFLRTTRIERDRCLHGWLRERLMWGQRGW